MHHQRHSTPIADTPLRPHVSPHASVRYFLLLAAYRRIGVRRVQNRSTPHCKAVFKVSEASRLCSPTRVSEVSRLCSPGVSAFFSLPAGARPYLRRNQGVSLCPPQTTATPLRRLILHREKQSRRLRLRRQSQDAYFRRKPPETDRQRADTA